MAEDSTEIAYSKDQIKIVGPSDTGGQFKRVFKVEIKLPSGAKRAILKFPRTFKAGSTKRLNEEEKGQLDSEAHDLRILKMLVPGHVPGYIGRYRSPVRDGILVEEVKGEMIADEKENIKRKPTIEQWRRFNNAILALADQDLFLDLDSLRLPNLMLGRLPDTDQEEIILIEPKIRQHHDPDMKIIERQFVLGGLREGFNRLFQEARKK